MHNYFTSYILERFNYIENKRNNEKRIFLDKINKALNGKKIVIKINKNAVANILYSQ